MREGGREGGREGREGYWGAREGGREGGRGGRGGREGGRGERERGRGGREGGMTVMHILIGMFKKKLYRNVLFMNSNMMHMLPTVHIIDLFRQRSPSDGSGRN